jgi:hypothetical protein
MVSYNATMFALKYFKSEAKNGIWSYELRVLYLRPTLMAIIWKALQLAFYYVPTSLKSKKIPFLAYTSYQDRQKPEDSWSNGRPRLGYYTGRTYWIEQYRIYTSSTIVHDTSEKGITQLAWFH